jgi:hypothetical protein
MVINVQGHELFHTRTSIVELLLGSVDDYSNKYQSLNPPKSTQNCELTVFVNLNVSTSPEGVHNSKPERRAVFEGSRKAV